MNDITMMQKEVGISACTDGMDNDEDGLVDCLDPDCSKVPACIANCPAEAPAFIKN